MAEPVRLQAAVAASPTGIKQEPQVETNILDGIDFNMIAELASKRSFDDISRDDDTSHDQESKRFKKETQIEEGEEEEEEGEEEQEAEEEDQEQEEEGEEELLEDGLALLVQNALSTVGDLVDQLNVDSGPHASDDPMDVSGAHSDDARPAPVSFLSEPEKYVRIANTHALGNLALSLLLVLLQQPVDDMSKMTRDAESGYGRSYGRLKRSFDATWQLFSDKAILSADELEIQEADARTLLDLANLAKFGTWLIEEDTDSFSAAQEHFTKVFECQLPDIPTGTSEVFVGIKTQKAIDALRKRGPEQRAEDLIRVSFTEGLERFSDEGLDGNELSSTAREMKSLIESRRDALMEVVAAKKEDSLEERYPAGDVLRGFATYVKSKLASLTELGEKLGVSALLSEVAAEEPVSNGAGDGDLDLDDLSSFFEKTTSGLVQNALAGFTEADEVLRQTETKPQSQSQPESSQSQSLVPTVEDADATAQPSVPVATTPTAATAPPPAEITSSATTETKTSQTNGKIDLMTDYKELEALVAESTSNYVKTTLHGLSAVPYQPTVPTSTTESMAAQSAYLSHLQQHPAHHTYYTYTQPSMQEPQTPPPPGSTENLPPNQTFPSAVLYDKARQAALSKSSAHTRREGLHSTRRPWTQEEEKALMAGLDMVKGPHWSQILTLFGQNGTISDILKDRTQVQLKDKARNLKLFFLKTNSEMPYYLQAVTGELKTRAPTQAARKEAEERARLNSEEEQAKLQGIMALAGGLQQQQTSQQQVRPVTSTAVVTPGVVTPAQAAHQVASAQHASHLQAAATAHHSPSTIPVSRSMVMPTPQVKTEMQATTPVTAQQQAIQSVSQAPARPQAQAHSLHEPQQQPQQQQQQSQMHNHLPQQPQQQQQQQISQPPRHDTQTPGQVPSAQNGAPVATPLQSNQHLSSTTPPAPVPIPSQQTPQAHRLSQSSGPSQPSTHSPQPSSLGPTHPETRRVSTVPEAPMSHVAAQDDDAATEAALLEGLQAVVAQALAS